MLAGATRGSSVPASAGKRLARTLARRYARQAVTFFVGRYVAKKVLRTVSSGMEGSWYVFKFTASSKFGGRRITYQQSRSLYGPGY